MSDGEGISYPTSEVAGQLYAYRMSQDLVVLGTRGLVPNSGASVGVKEIANGMYTCVAVNNEANNSQTVVIDVDGECGTKRCCTYCSVWHSHILSLLISFSARISCLFEILH